VRGWIEQGASGVLKGEPGIGKSALVAAALAGRSDDLLMRGIAVLGSVPYSPIRVARPEWDTAMAPAALADAIVRRLAPDAYVVVDDLHWCDDDTLAVIAELALRRPVLATVRARWVLRPSGRRSRAKVRCWRSARSTSRRPALVQGCGPARRRMSNGVCAAQGNPFALHRLALDRPTGTDLSWPPRSRCPISIPTASNWRVALAGTPMRSTTFT
jgi:hypothetical protein